MRIIITIATLVFLQLLPFVGKGQQATIGDQIQYKSDEFGSFSASWTLSGLGEIVSTSKLRDPKTGDYNYYATVHWSSVGTATLSLLEGSSLVQRWRITVGCGVNAPTVSVSSSTSCGSSTQVTMTGTTTAGNVIRWYTAASGGTPIYTGTQYSTTVIAPTTYYVAAYGASLNCESPRVPTTVSLEPIPGAPVNPGNASRCGDGAMTLSAAPGSNGASLIWYDAEGTKLVQTSTYSVTIPVGTVSFYVSSLSPSGKCESSERTKVTATAYPIPAKPEDVTDDWIYGGSGSILMRVGTSGSNEQAKWYSDAALTNQIAVGPTYQTPILTSPTTYYVRSTDQVSGCQGDVGLVNTRFINLVSPVSVTTDIIRTPNVKTDAQINTLPDAGKTTQYTYMDGLGRTVQQVNLRTSPTGKDLVVPVEYDAFGNTSKRYLPYASITASGQFRQAYKADQAAFYQASNDKIVDDAKPYALSVFENSPLGRLLEQGAVGTEWQPGQGHTKHLDYSFNDGSSTDTPEAVRRFNPDGTSTNYYDGNQLQRVMTVDEDGKNVIEFINSTGNTVVRKVRIDEGSYLETYYLYDLFDRLLYIIPPKGVAALKANGWNFTVAIKDSYAHQFVYDYRGRLVEKKVPGQAWLYYIYDKLDRLILVQDGFIRASKKWAFTKYDMQGRVVMQGLYFTTSQSRAVVQTMADALYTSANTTYPESAWYESPGPVLHGYTNSSFPKQNADNSAVEVLKINYYDNYDFDRNGTDDFVYTPQSLPGEGVSESAFTLPTGTKYQVLGTSTWLYQYIFYDHYQRIIQVRSNNHLSAVADNLSTIVYDFEGKVLIKKMYKKAGTGKETISQERYEYDATGRLMAVYRPVSKPDKINWINIVGASADKNSLYKVSASATWNAGAFSTNHLNAGQDGWVEFAATNTTTGKMLGFSLTDKDANYTSIDYALYASAVGAKVYVYEKGVNKGNFGTFTDKDIFSVERKGGIIYYKKNNQVLYTSVLASTTTLYVDCSILTPGGELRNATLFTSQEGMTAKYEYNELGQLVDKKLHNIAESSFLQSVDYRYTIHGSLSSINNASLSSNGVTNEDTDSQGDYFGMEFLYNTQQSGLGNAAYYNGNISAVKWKGVGAGTGATDQRSYKFTYDNSNKLTAATYQLYTGSDWTKETDANNEFVSYDLNGNIATLKRNQRKHQLNGTQALYVAEQIDNLTYSYSATLPDQLTAVEDASTNAAGFINGSTDASEYTYDANGSVTMDKNKNISAITYNVLGKPSQITFTDGRKIIYTYDASGAKLSMKSYQGATLISTTDYIESFVYENGILSFYTVTEGRIAMNGSNPENQYAIADQQGNTRVLLTSNTPEPMVSTATFEGDYADYSAKMKSVNPSFVVPFVSANNTPSGSKVVRMNQTYKVGPAASLSVYPGDKVDLEVWEYHESASGWGTSTTPLNTLVTMVAGSFGGVSGAVGESGAIYNGVNSAIGAFQPGNAPSDDHPAAYFNYILFDKNYNVLDMGWQITPATTMTRQKISFETLSVKEPGYLYVYLSYDDDSDNWVYFDDLKITHTPSNVIQYNEYYPFGLQTSSSWTRDNAKNSYLYNGGNELNATTGWYETFFRGYDPTLGRFYQVDPMAVLSEDLSVYQYADNNPIAFNDPLGDKAAPIEQDGALVDWRPFQRSTGSWISNVSSVEVNAQRMSERDFYAYYNIQTDDDKLELAKAASQYSTQAPKAISAILYGNYSITGNTIVYGAGYKDVNVELLRGAQQRGVVLDLNGNVLNWGVGNNIYVDVNGTNLPFHDRLVRNGTMTAEGFSNGLMSVVQGIKSPKFKFDASKLYNGKFSVAILANDNKSVISFNGGVLGVGQAGHINMPDGSHKISYYHINSGPGGLTVDLLRATLGVHEYYGHGMLGLDNSSKSHATIQTLVNKYLSDPNR